MDITNTESWETYQVINFKKNKTQQIGSDRFQDNGSVHVRGSNSFIQQL